jgi:hypothetical protein
LVTEILLEQKQLLGIVDSKEKAPDVKAGRECKAEKEQHQIAWLTILLAMKWSLQQQYGTQNNAKVLLDPPMEEYK